MSAKCLEQDRPLALGVLVNYVSLVYTKKGVTITKIDPKCSARNRDALKQNAFYRKLCAKAAQV